MRQIKYTYKHINAKVLKMEVVQYMENTNSMLEAQYRHGASLERIKR